MWKRQKAALIPLLCPNKAGPRPPPPSCSVCGHGGVTRPALLGFLTESIAPVTRPARRTVATPRRHLHRSSFRYASPSVRWAQPFSAKFEERPKFWPIRPDGRTSQLRPGSAVMHDAEAERAWRQPPGPTRPWRVPGVHVDAVRGSPGDRVGGAYSHSTHVIPAWLADKPPVGGAVFWH